MLHSNQNFTVDECRKIFAYFLNAKEIKQNFRRESYGYRTYNNSWKIFVNQKVIARHLYTQVLVNGEYETKLQERIYKIERFTDCVKITFFLARLI